MTSQARLMKAGQWDPKQKKVVTNRIPRPEPGLNQLIVKITSASLCHTDIMAIDRPDVEEPFTLGHEGAGIIDQLHPSAEGKGYKGNPEMQGWTQPGFFSEYAIVDYRNAIQLPKSWSLKTSSVFFCAGVTAFHAIDSCDLQPGQWLAVVGVGGLGQLAVQYAKAMGLKVVAVDINDKTLEVCKAQGADAIFNSRTDPEHASKIKGLSNGGVYAAAVFSNAKAAYANALDLIRVGGLLMVVGLPYQPLEVSTIDLALGKYRIKSDSMGTPQRLKKAVDFSAKHNIAPEVQLRKLEELNDMVNEMRAGTSTKRMAVAFD